MAINHRKKKSKASSSSSKKHQHSSSYELYQVENIIDDKLDKDGVTVLYKTRWKGYTAADDTWEPTENVASTGVSLMRVLFFSVYVYYYQENMSLRSCTRYMIAVVPTYILYFAIDVLWLVF